MAGCAHRCHQSRGQPVSRPPLGARRRSVAMQIYAPPATARSVACSVRAPPSVLSPSPALGPFEPL